MEAEKKGTSIDAIIRFVDNLVGPASRTLMRLGTSANQFNDIARWSFVKQFWKSRELWRHEEPTAMQGALMTGLTRVEVSRLRNSKEPQDALLANRQNRAARVIEGWLHDPAFQADAQPAPLPMTARQGASFNRLVQKYAAGVNIGSVVDDLIDAGCISVDQKNVVTLINPTYGLHFRDDEKLDIAGYMMRRLGETTDHNLRHQIPEQRRLQRIWRQRRIPKSALPAALHITTDIGVQAGRQIDAELSKLAVKEEGSNEPEIEVGICMYVYTDVEEG